MLRTQGSLNLEAFKGVLQYLCGIFFKKYSKSLRITWRDLMLNQSQHLTAKLHISPWYKMSLYLVLFFKTNCLQRDVTWHTNECTNQSACPASSVAGMASQALVLNSQRQQMTNWMTSSHSAVFCTVMGEMHFGCKSLSSTHCNLSEDHL